MDINQYNNLELLINEYYEDLKNIKPDRIIIQNYPKLLLISSASQFEHQIKDYCHNFLCSPNCQLNGYPQICHLQNVQINKPMTDKMFAKFEAYMDNGSEHLNAENFYNLFNGALFKTSVQSHFNSILQQQKTKISAMLSPLEDLVDQDEEKYGDEYINYDDLLEKYNNLSFSDAETSYLRLKYKRNLLAHDYLNGILDTFEDIKSLYSSALIYVLSVQAAIEDLT